MWDLDRAKAARRAESLNTLFVRYGCGTRRPAGWTAGSGLNTLFVRYGCGTDDMYLGVIEVEVLIPYSSGMGVGLYLGVIEVEVGKS